MSEITRWPFHVTGSKWQIDVNALTQSHFSLLPNSKASVSLLFKRMTAEWLRRFHTNQLLLMVDGFVVLFFLCQWILEAASVRQRQFIMKRENQWPLFSLPWSLTLSQWQSEEEIYWDNRGRQTGWRGKEHKERQEKKEDRQTWSRDRMKATGHITVNKTKTPKTTFCQRPGSRKIYHNMKAKAFSVPSWSVQREVSHNIQLN